MRGDRRPVVVDGIFRTMPDVFRADRAGSLQAIVHWRISGRTDGGEDVYEMQIADGQCSVSAVVQRQPTLTVRLDGVNFLKMATGNANARMLFLRGRLKARGDLALTNRLPSLFNVPPP
ncbi:SCP2 sterol-binding domain-containing protein [Micromonospora sp. LOL_014]